MTESSGKRGTLYEQVLDYARREIDDASSKIEELRRTLSLLEARVEAAKSVYEAVAARLNLEDELEEGIDFHGAAYPDAPPPLQVPEPPEETEAAAPSNGGDPGGFSMDLIRRHIEARTKQSSGDEAVPDAPPPAEVPEPSETAAAAPSAEGGGAGFDMDLIRRHLEARAGRASGDNGDAPGAPPPVQAPEPSEEAGAVEPSGSGGQADVSMDLIRRHLQQRAERATGDEGSTEAPEPSDSGTPGSGTAVASGFPGLSEADRRLIEEHMRRRAEGEG